MFKKITAILILTFLVNKSFSQSVATLAQIQAQRMKDSVGVSETVKQQVYIINLEIATRKLQARKDFSANPQQMREQVQQYENQRDSLYRRVLGSEEKYLLYKQKKNNILKAN